MASGGIDGCRKNQGISHLRQSKESSRIKMEEAICMLWVAFDDMSENELTEQDLQLWVYITGHDAVQSRLDVNMGRGENESI